MNRIIFTYAILVFMLLPVHSLALSGDDSFRGPWETPPAAQEKKAKPPVEEKAGSWGLFQTIAVKSLVFFQKVISPTDGDRCPMVPSCSTYGKQAIKKHGFALGIIMMTARLTHEREETKFSFRIKTDTGYRFYDPVEYNDFWFSDPVVRQPEQ